MLAPISSTSYFSSTPRSASATAVFSAVWPPSVASSASGRSFAMTFSTYSGVIGSTYVASANSGSVMIVAGLEFTSTTRSPSALSTRHACVPGTQACRVLKAEGLRVVLVNSNPATIMTDPEFADATYVEPITPEYVEKVIAKERPDALLATLGGQTALNTAVALAERGVLEKYDVELIGASIDAIDRGENRQSFKKIVEKVGGEVARSFVCHTLEDCEKAVADLGYPVV